MAVPGFWVVLAFIFGIGAALAIALPRIKEQQELNEQIFQENEAAKESLTKTLAEQQQVNANLAEKRNELSELINTVSQKQTEADNVAKEYYDKALQAAELQFNSDLEKTQSEYQTAKEEYSNAYIQMLKDLTVEYNQKNAAIISTINQNQIQLTNLQKKLEKESAVVAAAVEANKRTAEMETKADFYKLQIPDADRAEMEEIRKCFSHLRNPEPLNKVIWKVYYEKPTTDLIGRVIGAGTHTGIYKITNTLNGMTYVGQSVNLADRWKQHIKRGIGADTPTKNKLYPAMLECGVENFSFEVIEECTSAELNEKEKFWTDYFKAQEFGYSIRKG